MNVLVENAGAVNALVDNAGADDAGKENAVKDNNGKERVKRAGEKEVLHQVGEERAAS